ncbi:putative holin-like toxin [Brevibacillus laterosporus]
MQFLHIPSCPRGVMHMKVKEALSLMISFGMLVATIILVCINAK